MDFFDGKVVLITGGTGSFGKRFIHSLLRGSNPRKAIVFSRDELKQYEMGQMPEFRDDERIRFFIGDVRDYDRLYRAFDGVDFVVHAAAMKQVPASEYNPIEAIKTNIHGAENVINAAIDQKVKRVIALSTDKACSPINLYGATKLVSDKLFVAGNAYAGENVTRMSVVRYGNVVGSRGSVVPLFKRLAEEGVTEVPITDDRMTRFWITLEQGVQFVMDRLADMRGGELFVPKIPSMKVVDLAHALMPQANINIIGIRAGEKLHEEMISADDARRTVDMGSYYTMQPEHDWWKPSGEGSPVPEGFSYVSHTNDSWLTIDELRAMSENV